MLKRKSRNYQMLIIVNSSVLSFWRILNICQSILNFEEHIPYEKTECHRRKLDLYIWSCFLVHQILTSSLIKNRRSGKSLSNIKIWDNKFETKWTLLSRINIFYQNPKNRSQFCAISFVLFLHVMCALLQKWKYKWFKMKSWLILN